MTDSFDPVSLQYRTMQEITKLYWVDFVLELPFDDSDRYWFDFVDQEKKKIMAHHKTVVERISKTLSSFLPKVLLQQLIHATMRMRRGYQEALICAEQYSEGAEIFKSKMPLHALTTGPYSAKHFIDLTIGHFDELAWAKRFVGDESQSVFSRFEFACHFCFEGTIKSLWFSTISQERHPYEGAFEELREKFSYFVAVWVCHLEDKFPPGSDFRDDFNQVGFKKARSRGLEHASRFFWARCSDQVKAVLMSEILEDDEELLDLGFQGYAGCVYFIYSLLSLEQKRNIINKSIEFGEYFIWTCLLLSPFYEPVLNDMLTIPFPASNRTFTHLISDFISEMLKMPLPEYKETFKALWKPLSQKQQTEIIESDTRIIEMLTFLKDMDLFETVIRPLPRDLKDRMLLCDWHYAGMSVLSQFLEEGDHDAVLSYILLFLVDRDPATDVLRVREDADDFLVRLTPGGTFTLWTVPESQRRELKRIVEHLQWSLWVLRSIQAVAARS